MQIFGSRAAARSVLVSSLVQISLNGATAAAVKAVQPFSLSANVPGQSGLHIKITFEPS